MPKIVLKNGVEVNVSGVMFNKEQRINVPRTYVTTVKKSVTKVSGDFFKVDVNLADTSIFHTLDSSNINTKPEITLPELDIQPEKVEEKKEEAPTELKLPEALAMTVEPEPVEAAETVMAATPAVEAPTVVEATPEPVKVEEANPTVVEPIPTPVMEVVPEPTSELKPSEEPVLAAEPISAEPVPEVKAEAPIEAPDVVIPIPTPVETSAEVKTDAVLTFDGYGESNLNKALGEVSEEKVVAAPQEGVESLREFGTDEPVPEVATEENVKTLTKTRGGFANNKFFMVVAIVFFIAACVFLGYEAFQYFQMK